VSAKQTSSVVEMSVGVSPEKRNNFSMVNSELRLEGLITLIQRDHGIQGAISRQVFGI